MVNDGVVQGFPNGNHNNGSGPILEVARLVYQESHKLQNTDRYSIRGSPLVHL